MFNEKKAKYILTGSLNAISGYSLGIYLYNLLYDQVHIILIAVLANIFSISFSFFTYRFFVFKSKGAIWKEYFRSYVVYGGAFIFSVVLIWMLVDILRIHIWISQAVVVFVTFIFSYFGHDKFTFKS